MNRKQRRELAKKLKGKGINIEFALNVVQAINEDKNLEVCKIHEGSKVKINVKTIKNRKNYESKSVKYKNFVEKNADTVFTAHVEGKGGLVSLVESPEWLFWWEDLFMLEE